MAPLPIGFAVFMVHLATIPVTGTGINPARSLGSAVIYNEKKAWDDHVSIPIIIFILKSPSSRVSTLLMEKIVLVGVQSDYRTQIN